MAFVNKTSLRSEFDSLKEQFETLKSQGKVSPELQILIRSMIVLFEVLISVFMEKTTKKTSKNSSIPPSQSDKDKTSTNRRSHGKGTKQNKKQFPGVKTFDFNKFGTCIAIIKLKVCIPILMTVKLNTYCNNLS